MDEAKIKEIFEAIRAAKETDDEPPVALFIELAEGALINLAKIAASCG